MLPRKLKEWFRGLLRPVGSVCSRLGIHPHVLTVIGLAFGVAAGGLFSLGLFRWAGLCVLVGGIFDMLDGHTARISGKKSSFGALFDSTVDRYAEIFVFTGLTVHYLNNPHPAVVVVIMAAIGGSLMVSYVKARAEGLGTDCPVGLMQRPERIVYIGVGAMVFGQTVIFEIVIGLIALVTNITVVQRVVHVYRVLRAGQKQSE